jgi:hypothetical protein
MKAVEVKLHIFLTSVIDRGHQLASHSDHFICKGKALSSGALELM